MVDAVAMARFFGWALDQAEKWELVRTTLSGMKVAPEINRSGELVMRGDQGMMLLVLGGIVIFLWERMKKDDPPARPNMIFLVKQRPRVPEFIVTIVVWVFIVAAIWGS